MAFIETIPPGQATGILRELYDDDLKNYGYVRTSTMALSLRPESIEAWDYLNKATNSTMNPRHYELATIAATSNLQCSL